MATDHMYGMNAELLLGWILKDLQENGSALGIVKDLFFTPRQDDPFRMERYGVILETPLGVAAGPHAQMAQNILASWLCGARYIELKTVQTLDKIKISKPCIEMTDEGYNCEWSQELTLDNSYAEYLKAWVLVHVLHDHFGYKGQPGLILNMSAGYTMEGILSPALQLFLDRMQDCSSDLEELKRSLAPVYPRVMELNIPACISNSLTISCMHGCPPEEVEKISLYFLEKRRLNTTLKLNPTLLGAKCVRGFLNKTLGYDVEIPDLAFEHDLPYNEALQIIKNCREAAKKAGVSFGVKLTNTLEAINSKQILPAQEKMIYMSGRALHPIAIALASLLQNNFTGDLDISFCAGLDALNIVDSFACGLVPLTICSDLLKPGGYGRLAQYLENLRKAMDKLGATSPKAFAIAKASAAAKTKLSSVNGLSEYKTAILKNLEAYAAQVTAEDSRYAKKAGGYPDIKTNRPLPVLDCAAAPCKSACPAAQNIPGYLGCAAAGDWDNSLGIILQTNPFPTVLGKLCTQTCRSKCVRQHYDQPLRIRDIKLQAARSGNFARKSNSSKYRKIAIVGAGPAGLTCAHFLSQAGCVVRIYEASEKAGGRILSKVTGGNEYISRDIQAILNQGMELHLGNHIDLSKLLELCTASDAVYVATKQNENFQDSNTLPNLFWSKSPKNQDKLPSLVESVGEGRRAALKILAHLGIVSPGGSGNNVESLDLDALRKKQAFRENRIEQTLTPESGLKEANRCLQCDRYCGLCVSVCPNRANLLLAAPPFSYPIQEAVRTPAGVHILTLDMKILRQSWQVINLGDFCNECGNCVAFCPSSGAPYRTKPRLHLSEASFQADNNGFFQRSAGLFEGKDYGKPWFIRQEETNYIYEDQYMRAKVNGETFAALEVELKNNIGSASLVKMVQAIIFCKLTADNAVLSCST